SVEVLVVQKVRNHPDIAQVFESSDLRKELLADGQGTPVGPALNSAAAVRGDPQDQGPGSVEIRDAFAPEGLGLPEIFGTVVVLEQLLLLVPGGVNGEYPVAGKGQQILDVLQISAPPENLFCRSS